MHTSDYVLPILSTILGYTKNARQVSKNTSAIIFVYLIDSLHSAIVVDYLYYTTYTGKEWGPVACVDEARMYESCEPCLMARDQVQPA